MLYNFIQKLDTINYQHISNALLFNAYVTPISIIASYPTELQGTKKFARPNIELHHESLLVVMDVVVRFCFGNLITLR